MIDYLDSFFDTKKKRLFSVQLLCLIGCLLVCCFAIYTACRLMVLEDYASLFSLLNDPAMELFVVSRMVLSMMSVVQGGFFSYLCQACTTITIWEWILFGVCMFMIYYSSRKRLYLCCLLLIAIYVLVCSFLFNFAIHATSLQEIIEYIRIIGIVSLVCFLVLLFVGGCLFLRKFLCYRKALKIHVIEIGEDNEKP